MKKLLFIVVLGVSVSTLMAQNKTLTMVMSYRWNFNLKTNTQISENKCEDGIEFDFTTGEVFYYTPDEKISETKCKVVKSNGPIANNDDTKTYQYDILAVGSGKAITCVLNISNDLKRIKFTMIDGDRASVYNVSNMLTDQDN